MRFKFVLVFIAIGLIAVGQKMVRDTSIIVFGDSINSEIPVSLKLINDNRIIPGGYLSTTTNKKYLYVPVDNYYVTQLSLSDNISRMFQSDNFNSNNNLAEVNINEFEIIPQKRYFKKGYVLNVNLEINIKNNITSDSCFGTLIYETFWKVKGKNQDSTGRVNTIQNWKNEFTRDVSSVTNYLSDKQIGLPVNFYKDQFNLRTNLIGGLDFIFSYDNYMIQGELMFSKPEARQMYLRKGHIVRYRNAEDFESIGFGRRASHFLKRRNNTMMFDISSSFIIAVNKWKDYKEVRHKLQEIVTLDYSFAQKIIYNPLNKRSVIIGAGLVENFYYIFNYGLSFRPGILLSLGIKV